MKRFYKTVAAEGRSLRLDDRVLKTPRGAPLDLPTQALAEAIAEEWRRSRRSSARVSPYSGNWVIASNKAEPTAS